VPDLSVTSCKYIGKWQRSSTRYSRDGNIPFGVQYSINSHIASDTTSYFRVSYRFRSSWTIVRLSG